MLMELAKRMALIIQKADERRPSCQVTPECTRPEGLRAVSARSRMYSQAQQQRKAAQTRACGEPAKMPDDGLSHDRQDQGSQFDVVITWCKTEFKIQVSAEMLANRYCTVTTIR